MSGKTKLSYTEKIRAINDYKRGEGSLAGIGRKYGIGAETLRSMVLKYESGLLSEL